LFKHDVLLSVEFLIRKPSLLLCGVTKSTRESYSIEKTVFFSALRSFYPHNNILCIMAAVPALNEQKTFPEGPCCRDGPAGPDIPLRESGPS
jgi:hypothetical protein